MQGKIWCDDLQVVRVAATAKQHDVYIKEAEYAKWLVCHAVVVLLWCAALDVLVGRSRIVCAYKSIESKPRACVIMDLFYVEC